MDWTGGVRRRFAPGKNNATVQRQKAHFAKARSALPNPPSSISSFRPAFYGKDSPRNGFVSSRYGHSVQDSTDRRSNQRGSRRTKKTHASKNAVNSRKPNTIHGSGGRDDVVYITSSSVKSSLSPRQSHRSAGHLNTSHSHSGRYVSNAANEEERLLMANRRRLLARSDWLGLSAARPLQMRFRSSHDRDRIGKRRRVANSTSDRGEAATRRLLTPPFEGGMAPMMSGALPQEEVRVRIGTDALASQTQQSRRSDTPRFISARPPSSDLGPLSEEPMLLGDEGDIFETMLSATNQHSNLSANDTMLAVPATHSHPGQVYQHEQGSENQVPNWNPFVIHAEIAHTLRPDNEQDFDRHYSSTTRFLPVSNHPMDVNVGAEDADIADETNVPPDPPPENVEADAGCPHSPTTRDDADAHAGGGVDDEAFWRRLMNLQEPITSDTSMHALKSSSLHNTTSDSSHRLDTMTNVADIQHALVVPSTPKGAGTQASMLHAENSAEQGGERSTEVQYPSASLKQILALSARPDDRPSRPQEDATEDVAWRDFVIGSQDSSTVSLRQEQVSPQDLVQDNDAVTATDLTMLNMSGLGTSVVSTAGGTHLLRQRPSSRELHASQQPNTANIHATKQQTRKHKIDSTQHQADDIEGNPPERRHLPRGPSRVETKALNPKRFKFKPRPAPDSISSSSRLTTTRRSHKPTKTRPRAEARSVYDLVDSE